MRGTVVYIDSDLLPQELQDKGAQPFHVGFTHLEGQDFTEADYDAIDNKLSLPRAAVQLAWLQIEDQQGHNQYLYRLKTRLHVCKCGEIANVAHLSASIRHIFAHGDLSANANGIRSPTLYPLCASVSVFLLDFIDAEFTQKIDDCYARIQAKSTVDKEVRPEDSDSESVGD